jgi:hypothetical protein
MDEDGLRLLRWLAKRGAVIELREGVEGRLAAFRNDADGASAALGSCRHETLAAAAAARWVVQEPDSTWRLTRVGRTALMRALSRSPGSHGDDGRSAGHDSRPPAPLGASEPAARRSPARRSSGPGPCESPLDWLRRRRDKSGEPMIADEQYRAGERLRADHWYAGMSPRVTASWSVVAPCSRGAGVASQDLADNVLAARERVDRALTAVGPELSGILLDVCCHLIGLEQVEWREGWPQRSGKLVLQLALTALARHYGFLPPIAPSGAAAPVPRTRHWGAPGYRPRIDGRPA